MPIHHIAPLALVLLLSPCALAQTSPPADPPSAPAKPKGQWYFSTSIAAVDGPDYAYDSSATPGVFSISYATRADTGAAIEESVGYAFANGFRAEAAVTFQSFDEVRNLQHIEIFSPFVDTFDIDFTGDRIETAGLTLNGYYDFRKDGQLRPYVGLGAGLANVEIQDGVINADETVFSLQAMAGLSFKASRTTSVFLEGRWQQFPDLEFRAFDISTSERITPDASFSSASIRAGMRLSF